MKNIEQFIEICNDKKYTLKEIVYLLNPSDDELLNIIEYLKSDFGFETIVYMIRNNKK